jgi:hypothetical protein
MGVTAGMLFLESALQLLRNSRAAFPVFAVAWVLGAIGNWISQSMPVYREGFSFAVRMFMRDRSRAGRNNSALAGVRPVLPGKELVGILGMSVIPAASMGG